LEGSWVGSVDERATAKQQQRRQAKEGIAMMRMCDDDMTGSREPSRKGNNRTMRQSQWEKSGKPSFSSKPLMLLRVINAALAVLNVVASQDWCAPVVKCSCQDRVH
jgi:hypothetical protein